MTDNSKIGDEFEQNKLLKVCIANSLFEFIPPILELSIKFASQICHENINKSLDGAYLAVFGIDIKWTYKKMKRAPLKKFFEVVFTMKLVVMKCCHHYVGFPPPTH